MKQIKTWIENFIKTLNSKNKGQKDGKFSQYFDQLIYGKAYECIYEKRYENIIFYLSEDVPEMIIGVLQKQKEIYFNLRQVKIIEDSSLHEMQYKLKQKEYLIFQHERSDFVLLFRGSNEGEKLVKFAQRIAFKQFFDFYLNELKKSPFEIESLLLYTFITVDKNKNMTLQSSQVSALLSKLQLKTDNQQFRNIITYVRKQLNITEGQVTYNQFEKVMKLMECRLQFKSLFQSISNKKIKSYRFYMQKSLLKKDFIKFLIQQQKQKNPNQIANNLYDKQQAISFYDFSLFMLSQQLDAYDSQLQNIQINSSYPLTQYFCRSSHNTYLTGNQLTSDSKKQRYRQDLQNGYRCLQIDIHNGEFQPIVKHGFTMTSSITFSDVIDTIYKFTKQNDDHSPIILSLQNHANEKQQQKMAAILRNNFGKKILYVQQFMHNDTFPSLKDLKGKIIIKNQGTFLLYQMARSDSSKNLVIQTKNSEIDSQEDNHTGSTLIFQDVPQDLKDDFHQFNTIKDTLQKQKKAFIKSQTVFKRQLGQRQSIIRVAKQAPTTKKSVHPQMLLITSMFSSGSLKKPCIWQSVSLTQGTVNSNFANNFNEMKVMTEKYWIRSYPSASRVDSSNYNPLNSLQMGIQLVAINSQFCDHYNALLKYFFRVNNKQGEGYRLKKQCQLKQQIIVKIRPISGSMITTLLDNSIIPDVQVKMSFLGCASDSYLNESLTKMQAYTEVIKENGYNPIFQSSRTMQVKVNRPVLAFIFIQVPYCGIGVIAIQGLKNGYRSVTLFDQNLQEKKSKIFFKISKQVLK